LFGAAFNTFPTIPTVTGGWAGQKLTCLGGGAGPTDVTLFPLFFRHFSNAEPGRVWWTCSSPRFRRGKSYDFAPLVKPGNVLLTLFSFGPKLLFFKATPFTKIRVFARHGPLFFYPRDYLFFWLTTPGPENLACGVPSPWRAQLGVIENRETPQTAQPRKKIKKFTQWNLPRRLLGGQTFAEGKLPPIVLQKMPCPPPFGVQQPNSRQKPARAGSDQSRPYQRRNYRKVKTCPAGRGHGFPRGASCTGPSEKKLTVRPPSPFPPKRGKPAGKQSIAPGV